MPLARGGGASTFLRHGLVVVGAYAALVGLLTWPLLPNAGTHLSAALGRFHLIDTLQVAWINAHETRALATMPLSLLDAGIYHPASRTLFYGTASLGLLPYFAPTFLATGNPVLALNVAYLACVALTASAIHLVAHRWTHDHLAGAVAGWTFLMSRTSLWGFVSGAPLYAPLAYLPVLIHAAATKSLGGIAPWVVVALIALQSACDPLYLAPVVLGPLVALGLWKLRAPTTREDGAALLRSVAIAGVLLLPIYAGYADVVARNPRLAEQTVWMRGPRRLSVDELHLPLALHVAGHVLGWLERFCVPVVALALIVVGAAVIRRQPTLEPELRTAWRHCAFWILAALLLPAATTVAPVLRAIARGGLVGLPAAALLAGLAFAACLRGRGRGFRASAACVLAALLFAVPPLPWKPSALASSFPYPIQRAPRHNPTVRFALELRRGPVLEIPAGVPLHDSIAQFQAVFHGRRLLNGYGSYYPAALRQQMGLVRRLPHPGALYWLHRTTGLDTIVVHARYLDAAARRAWDHALRWPRARPGFVLTARYDDVYVFDVVLGLPAAPGANRRAGAGGVPSRSRSVSAGRGTAGAASR